MSVPRVVYLSGGVGGARLAHGLAKLLDRERITFVVNTGDDLVHWGLHVSPDLDTMLYTLADVGDLERGWGLAGDTFHALQSIGRYGGEQWFALGDRDLATHLLRSQWLRDGETLTCVTARLCQGLGVSARILPMSDGHCETMIASGHETLAFQHWLVQRRAAPPVDRVWFRGSADATPEVLTALDEASLVIIGPSNPYVSIDPILALPGVRERVLARPVIAVSPIVHGRAVKGPLAGMLHTLSQAPVEPASIAHHYGDLLDAIAVERGDETSITGLPVLATDTVMSTRPASRALAEALLGFARELGFFV
jgi:LPPG:FO 2-phospho-L-lactate transferase